MTSTATAPAAFDLLAPITGTGRTHLRHPDRGGILCANPRARYGTFTVVGIVPAGTATCDECNRVASS